MSSIVDCTGLDIYDVILALWRGSKPATFFAIANVAPPPAPSKDDIDKALTIYGTRKYIDYLNGRVFKINFDDFPLIDVRLYDRDNGAGAAASVVAKMQGSTDV